MLFQTFSEFLLGNILRHFSKYLLVEESQIYDFLNIWMNRLFKWCFLVYSQPCLKINWLYVPYAEVISEKKKTILYKDYSCDLGHYGETFELNNFVSKVWKVSSSLHH